MSSMPWQPDEVRDAATHATYSAFAALWPARSREAWMTKRKRLKHLTATTDTTAETLQDVASYAVPPSPPPPDVDPYDASDDEGELMARVDDATARAAAVLDDAALFDAVLAYQTALKAAFPYTLEHAVTVPNVGNGPICIAFPSDWHIGSEGCDLERIRTDCQLIASHPRMYVALGGDPVDNFILGKMGSAARTQSAQVQVQWRLFRYCVQLIEPKLLWVSSGNHDAWTAMVAGIDGVLAALHGIPVVYTGEGGYIDVRVGRQVYTVWRKHRPSRYTSSFNSTHFLKQMLRIVLPREYDIGVSEHLHTEEVNEWTYRGRKRILLCCGSYKVKDKWADDNNFLGGGYGVPCVVLWPNEHRMLSFFSLRDAIATMDALGASPGGAPHYATSSEAARYGR